MYCLISAILGLGENADEILLGERLQLHANGKAALQLRNQIAGLGDVERARGDEQNVVGAHHAVARVDRGAFDDRQNVALHAFAADVGAVPAFASGDFVDFVEEDDAAAFSTRSMAMRVTWSMSIRRCSSSWTR